MIKRIITALVIIGVVIPPLLLGGYFLDALIALIVVVGGFELLSLMPSRKYLPTVFIFLLLVATFGISYLPMNVSVASFGLLMLVVLAIPVFYEKFLSSDAIFMIGVLALFFVLENAFLSVYDCDSRYIWFVLLSTYGCDTGAYFIGVNFGKRKLIPTISPNKSVEGAVGGWAVGATFAFLYTYFVFPEMPLLAVILGSLWLPVISQIGDLSFSAIKRNYNIKDFSNIFPGHGGFMDRLDSLTFNIIFFFCILELALW